MKKRTIIGNILLTLLAVLTLHLSARYLGFVMMPRSEVEGSNETMEVRDYSSYYFTREKPNSADTLFIGSSHVYCGIDVNIMNKEYGKNALMLATSSQTLDLSYYAIMSAIPMQHPERIYLETFCAVYDEQKQKPLSSRALLNDLPNWSRGKWLAAKDSGQPMYYYFYPITDMHNTWWKVTSRDFILPRLPEGERYSFHGDRIRDVDDWTLSASLEDVEIPEESLYWLRRIVQLCRENNTELILFTAPYPADAREQTIFRLMADFAKENGLVYYNLVDDYEKVGIDLHSDFFDGNHMNIYGQEKLSRYMAENCMN